MALKDVDYNTLTVYEKILYDVIETRNYTNSFTIALPLYDRMLFTTVVDLTPSLVFGAVKDEDGKREVTGVSRNAVGMMHKLVENELVNLKESVIEHLKELVDSMVTNPDSELVQEFFDIFENGYDKLDDEGEKINDRITVNRVVNSTSFEKWYTDYSQVEDALQSIKDRWTSIHPEVTIEVEEEDGKLFLVISKGSYTVKREYTTVLNTVEFINNTIDKQGIIEVVVRGEFIESEIVKELSALFPEELSFGDVHVYALNKYTVGIYHKDEPYARKNIVVSVKVDPNKEEVNPPVGLLKELGISDPTTFQLSKIEDTFEQKFRDLVSSKDTTVIVEIVPDRDMYNITLTRGKEVAKLVGKETSTKERTHLLGSIEVLNAVDTLHVDETQENITEELVKLAIKNLISKFDTVEVTNVVLDDGISVDFKTSNNSGEQSYGSILVEGRE